ncbi:hypothetical protein LNN31_08200 [Acetobacterium wieringae]|uniref:Histidine kinase N-terminal 7TM region domain-containing protein n=1 Tax=Acetobacterium wieringae TaxID=52694 RepID=A0ABY6HIR2_9FIRM|nr:hypothetical protein [Acetobacterium wieringae]UYO64390.1 hypothetical protein LNN31_08200 [Acetobacterium wieringae]
MIMLYLSWNIKKRRLISFDFQIDLLLFLVLPYIIIETSSMSKNLHFQGILQVFFLCVATYILFMKSKDLFNSVFQYVLYYSIFIWIYAFISTMILLSVIYNILNDVDVMNFLDRDPGNNWYFLLTGFAILVYCINGVFIKQREFEITKVALTIVAAIFGVLAAFSDIIRPFKLPFLSDQIIDSELIIRLTIPYLSGTLVALAIINYREFRYKQIITIMNNDKK